MPVSSLRFFTDRIINDTSHYDYLLDRPEKIMAYWREHIASDPTIESRKEQLIVIPVDSRLKSLGHTLISTGLANETLANPVEILRPVILSGAYNYVMAHNHPSGDTSPSSSDIAITKQIREAADLLKIRVVDHVIIGTHPIRPMSYFSFQEGGRL